jgi:DNA polymerase-3 subunit beta
MLAETAFACSRDDKRPILNGCFIQLDSGRLHVVGCSGFMLAVSTAATDAGAKHKFIVPAATAKELLRLLSDDIEKPHRLTVTAGPNVAQFAFGDITIVSRLIEGEYPKYQTIIPAENLTSSVPRGELVRSIGRMALVADQVKISFTSNTLDISSVGKRGTEFIGEASDSLLNPANHAVAATFSTNYLTDILTAIPDGALELHINATGASLFKAPGRDWRAVLASVQTEPKPGPATAAKPDAAAAEASKSKSPTVNKSKA